MVKTSSDVRWAPHRDGRPEDARRLAARKWLGTSLGASWDCNAGNGRLLPASCPRYPHKKSSSNHCIYCNTVRMNAIHSQSLFAWTLKGMSETLISPLGKLYTASNWSELCASMLMWQDAQVQPVGSSWTWSSCSMFTSNKVVLCYIITVLGCFWHLRDLYRKILTSKQGIFKIVTFFDHYWTFVVNNISPSTCIPLQ